MPFISDAQMQRVRDTVARAKGKGEEKAGEIKTVGLAVGAASVIGFVRGKMEEPDGSWNIPSTPIDIEFATGTGICIAAFFDVFGRYDDDLLIAGAGILSHYGGQVFRKYAKTGAFSTVAGINGLPGGGRFGALPWVSGGAADYIGQDASLASALSASGV